MEQRQRMRGPVGKKKKRWSWIDGGYSEADGEKIRIRVWKRVITDNKQEHLAGQKHSKETLKAFSTCPKYLQLPLFKLHGGPNEEGCGVVMILETPHHISNLLGELLRHV